jgi:predicted membrane-bound mannosyltransferase
VYYHVDKGPVWTEALILLLAVVGAASGFIRKKLRGANASFVRFLGFYSFGLLAAYSLISYKTPWCLLGFWHGMILLAGVGAAVLTSSFNQRAAKGCCVLLISAATAHLGWQAWQLSFPYATDTRNPHVYAHTSPSVLDLVERVKKIADASRDGRRTLVKVITLGGDCWPLPWYLRSFSNVGYWDTMPPDPYAPIMIVSAGFQAGLDANKTHLMNGYFQLRPENFLELYVRLDTWLDYLKKYPPKRDED